MENIIVYHVTKFDKNPLKIKGDIINYVKGVWVLVNPLYISENLNTRLLIQNQVDFLVDKLIFQQLAWMGK